MRAKFKKKKKIVSKLFRYLLSWKTAFAKKMQSAAFHIYIIYVVSGDKNGIPQNQTTSHNVSGRPCFDQKLGPPSQKWKKIKFFSTFDFF